MSDNIFIDGMMFKRPNEKAPNFVKGSISVNIKNFSAFMEKHKDQGEWLNIDLKEAKSGNLYLALNTYKKENKADVPF